MQRFIKKSFRMMMNRMSAVHKKKVMPIRQVVPAFVESVDYWEQRYQTGGNSGSGSYGKLAVFKAEIINRFVDQHGIESIIEFGCGDGNQLALARYPHYLGFDVSPTAVALCKALFFGDTTKAFRLADTYQGEQAALTLSLDVIFHLVEDDIFEAYMRRLFSASNRYVIIYSSNTNRNVKLSAHCRNRKFTNWLQKNVTDWTLCEYVPNRYPYKGNQKEESISDFYIYERNRQLL